MATTTPGLPTAITSAPRLAATAAACEPEIDLSAPPPLAPLTAEDVEMLVDLIENPPEPTPAFLAAAERYRRRRSG